MTCKTYIPVEICLKPKMKGVDISQTFKVKSRCRSEELYNSSMGI